LAAETSRGAAGWVHLRGRYQMLASSLIQQFRTFIRCTATPHVVRDVLIVLLLLTLGAGPCRMLDRWLPLAKVTLVMSLFAAMAGIAAAMLAVLSVRLTGDRR